jgi:hypothetical protein
MRTAMLFGELFERLLALDIFFPEFSTDSGIASW